VPPEEGEDPRVAESDTLVTHRDHEASPRERARVNAVRGCLAFGRLLFAVALVEIVAATVRAIAEPDPTPAVLGHLAAFARTAYAVYGVIFAARFVPLARAVGVRSFALTACVFFALSSLAALLPFFAVVPESLGDATWDALLQIIRGVSFLAGTSLTLLVARAFAERESQHQIARHLGWTLLPLLTVVSLAGTTALSTVIAVRPAVPRLLRLRRNAEFVGTEAGYQAGQDRGADEIGRLSGILDRAHARVRLRTTRDDMFAGLRARPAAPSRRLRAVTWAPAALGVALTTLDPIGAVWGPGWWMSRPTTRGVLSGGW